MTTAEVNAILSRQSAGAAVIPPLKRTGRGVVRVPGRMNKTESAYSRHLEALKKSGAVLWWKFEAVTLKLTHDTRLTMDFAVMNADGFIELHDTKGRSGKSYYAEEDSKLKIKTAAEMFPFRFFIVWPTKTGGWETKEILP